jgi:hypothetical protein
MPNDFGGLKSLLKRLASSLDIPSNAFGCLTS